MVETAALRSPWAAPTVSLALAAVSDGRFESLLVSPETAAVEVDDGAEIAILSLAPIEKMAQDAAN